MKVQSYDSEPTRIPSFCQELHSGKNGATDLEASTKYCSGRVNEKASSHQTGNKR